MSNHAAVVLQLRTACQHCFSRQLELLDDSSRVESSTKVDTGQLFILMHKVDQLDPFPEVAAEKQAKLATISAVVHDASSVADFGKMSRDLAVLMRSICQIPAPAAPLEHELTDEILTDQPINQRIINQLFRIPGLVRSSRRRINNDGGGYDKDAYNAARNRVNLAEHVYRDQLNHDVLTGTVEEAATLEKIHCKAVGEATAATFVSALEGLATFLQERVLA